MASEQCSQKLGDRICFSGSSSSGGGGKKRRALKIVLTMIVKNEAHIIEQTLTNVMRHCPLDGYAIVDTGSTDRTRELIHAFFATRRTSTRAAEGCSMERFSTATSATTLPTRATSRSSWRPNLPSTRSCLTQTICLRATFAAPTRPRPRPTRASSARAPCCTASQLLRLDAGWHYVGALHEVLVNHRPGKSRPTKIEGAYMIVSRRLGARSQVDNKYARDALALLSKVEEHQRRIRESASADRELRERFTARCTPTSRCSRRGLQRAYCKSRACAKS